MGHSTVQLPCTVQKRPNRSTCRFGWRLVGWRNHVLDGSRSPKGKGQFSALTGPFKNFGNLRCSVAVVANGIIQLPITSCSRRDHSVCQASTNSILKISGCRQCGLSVVGYLQLSYFRGLLTFKMYIVLCHFIVLSKWLTPCLLQSFWKIGNSFYYSSNTVAW